MTEDEKKAWAQYLAEQEVEYSEYCSVYECEELLDETQNEDDWRDIHRYITKAKVTLSWD